MDRARSLLDGSRLRTGKQKLRQVRTVWCVVSYLAAGEYVAFATSLDESGKFKPRLLDAAIKPGGV